MNANAPDLEKNKMSDHAPDCSAAQSAVKNKSSAAA